MNFREAMTMIDRTLAVIDLPRTEPREAAALLAALMRRVHEQGDGSVRYWLLPQLAAVMARVHEEPNPAAEVASPATVRSGLRPTRDLRAAPRR